MKKMITEEEKMIYKIRKYLKDNNLNDEFKDIETTDNQMSVYEFNKILEAEFLTLDRQSNELLKLIKSNVRKNFIDSFIPDQFKHNVSLAECTKIEVTQINQEPTIFLYDNKGNAILMIMGREDKPKQEFGVTYYYLKEKDRKVLKQYVNEITKLILEEKYLLDTYGTRNIEEKAINDLISNLKLIDELDLLTITFRYDKENKKINPILTMKNKNSLVDEPINLIDKNKDNILRKIPITISKLEIEYQNIINHQRNKQITNKPATKKSLIKKRTKLN